MTQQEMKTQKKRASNATLLDQSAFKKDGTLVLSEAYIKNNIKNIDLSTILFQTAYHGTPHNFDKFSTSTIGTGEGNQSFGWGLYCCITSRKRKVVLLKQKKRRILYTQPL